VLRDRERRIFSDPSKIHEIRHVGKHFQVPGIHLCEPSPQRTPVLYQAGASSRGKQFAAEHAECVFVAAPSKVLLKKTVADIRRRAAEAGRDPKKVLIFNLQTVIVGETDAKAKAKFDEYKTYVSYEGAMALISGWTGIDFSQFKPDEPLKHVHTNAIQSAVEAFSSADPNKIWTPTNWPTGSASAALGRCSSAARKPWPTCYRSGLKRRTWTASTWRMR
jgi:alkanesulfonate monooxygenase SsuD/methylene tetrahydromethanopterin reductase-like flavin-dependent oxidoreductase (luciferase family)